MTRVAIVTTEPTASRVPQLDRLARRDGLELMVFYAAESVQERSWTLTLDHPHEILRGPTVPLTRLLQHDYPVTPSLWRKLDAGRFDCVVVWGWSTFAAQLAIVWARRRHVPYVLFAESHLQEPRRAWVRAVKQLAVPRVVRPAAAWLAAGTVAREHLVHYGADPARTWTFANTVDVEALAGQVDELRERRNELRAGFELDDQPVVLHAGRLLPVKGVDVLVDAVGQVDGVQLLVVGDGRERAALVERAARLGVRARFAGFLPAERLAEAYAAADIFALLSRRESWGVVVTEATAAGLPLVLSDTVGAARDLLRNGENGELVPAGDAEATAAAIARLVASAELRARYGAASRALVAGRGYGPSEEAFAAAMAEATTK
jgi:glycosyltransferase involved in cell wall biosynthesis